MISIHELNPNSLADLRYWLEMFEHLHPEKQMWLGGDKWWVDQRMHDLQRMIPFWRENAIRPEYV